MVFISSVKNPERIKVYLNDPDRKSILLVLRELVILLFHKKEIPYYYFNHLYKKEITNIRDFLSTKERARIHAHPEMRKTEFISILENKLNFALYFEKFELNSPRALGHNFQNKFSANGRSKNIVYKEQLKIYFQELFMQNGIEELFARPLQQLGGIGCFKLTSRNFDEKIEAYFKEITNGNYIYTPIVVQHPDVNEIHKNSINTIRLLTLIKPDGDVVLISAAMRFGVGDSIVDNNSSGGFYIGVDIDKTALRPAGWFKVEFGGKKITHHPDSNYQLGGFKIPFFKEACDMVCSYTEYIPNKIIGWDVAITPDGPTIIEANHNPLLVLSDIANEGILKNPYFKEFLDSVNVGR